MTISRNYAKAEKVQRSIAAFQKMIPLFESFAEAVYGKKIPIKMPNKSVSPRGILAFNDGQIIYIVPPASLGDHIEHNRLFCGRNDERGVSLCPACARFELIFSSVCHEIAHFTGGTLGATTTSIRSISARWGKSLWNILEDIRIENLMFAAQTGTRVMRHGTMAVILDNIDLENIDLNRWACLAILADACGVDFIKYPKSIENYIQDPAIQNVIDQARNAKSTHEIINLIKPLIKASNPHGVFLTEEEEEEREKEKEQDGDSSSDSSEDRSESSDSDQAEDDSKSEGEDSPNSEPEQEGSEGSDSGESGAEYGDSIGQGADGTGKLDSESSKPDNAERGTDSKDSDDRSDDEEDGGSPSKSGAGSDDSEGEEESDSEAGDSGNESTGDSYGDFKSDLDSSERNRGDNQAAESEISSGSDEGKDSADSSDDSELDDSPREPENYGNPGDFDGLLDKIMGHGVLPNGIDDTREIDEFQKVYAAYEDFQEDAGHVVDVIEVKWNGRNWVEPRRSISGLYYDGKMKLWESGSHTNSALSKMRIVFSENDKSRTSGNLRSGKVNTRALGKRAPAKDERLFKRKTRPKKRDYAVVMILDVSGSVGHGEDSRLHHQVSAANQQAELLDRMGIKFKMIAHSGLPRSGEEGYLALTPTDDCWSFIKITIKDWQEPWTDKNRVMLESLIPFHANLDGHAMGWARREILTRHETDRVVIYYSDGGMPMENGPSELKLLKKELKILNSTGVVVAGVGIHSDAPKKHGLPTVIVREKADIPRVVDHLEGLILEMRKREV